MRAANSTLNHQLIDAQVIGNQWDFVGLLKLAEYFQKILGVGDRRAHTPQASGQRSVMLWQRKIPAIHFTEP
ncbi:hypothetical protein [Nitrosomonas sp.]|uniref:hypothetical protein n=1 Tax=Nitrosomonas sp. TaxID=42353 RepID=UPI00374CF0F8